MAYPCAGVSEETDSTQTAAAVAKGALMGIGGLVALGVVLSLIKPLALIAVAGGAGYLGYRMLSKSKRLGPAAERRALGPASGDDDFNRRMKELDALERKLDREIGKY